MSQPSAVLSKASDELQRLGLRRFWSPANVVITISTALIAIIFAIFAALCVEGYNSVFEQAKSRAQTAADVVAEEVGGTLGGARALLAHLAAEAAMPAGTGGLNKTAIDAAVQLLPYAKGFALFDAHGTVVRGFETPSMPMSISGLDIFARLSTGGPGWAISRQLTDAATGAPIFAVAQVLHGRSSDQIAVIVFSGDLIEQLWGPQKLGADSTVSILTDDGWVVARHPALPATMNSSQAPLFNDLRNSDSGTYVSARSPADGIARIVGFRRLLDLNVVAIASVSQDAAFAPLWNSIGTVLWLMVPIALALLLGSLATAHILRKSERTQAHLADALAHNDVLFREIHHRVKNNLQSVSSLLQMQPIPRDIKADMSRRLAAMSAVHEHIYRSSDFSTVAIKSYLDTLIDNIRAGADAKIQVVEEIEDLSVDKDVATPLGLILNEVLSNAFKHAFPDGRAGIITVQLARGDDGRGRLIVADNGVGFDPSLPAKGIGQKLIKAFAGQLGGVVETTSGGTGSRFAMAFPLAK